MLSAIASAVFPEQICRCCSEPCDARDLRGGYCVACWAHDCPVEDACRLGEPPPPRCVDCGESAGVIQRDDEIGGWLLCEDCDEERDDERDRIQERAWRVTEAVMSAMCGIDLTKRLAHVAGERIAVRVAAEGRLAARISGEPSRYPDHVSAELMAHEESR